METSFKIYSASAGSGKTFTLVKEYLKILISSKTDKVFHQILAVTFTNKAVNEMKRRVLDSLYSFSKDECPKSSQALFQQVCSEIAMSPVQVRTKSKRVLKEILHNYAFFDVSTIDRFTHRLIRTFSKDLKLPPNFEVVLDTDTLLAEAVERLLNKAGTEELLTNILVDFALEKVAEDRSWDISLDLHKTGRLLFQENQIPFIKSLSGKSLADFERLKKTLKTRIKSSEEKATSFAQEALNLIDENGFTEADFPRQTLPNHFKKIIASDFDPSRLYSNQLEENLKSGKVLKVSVSLPSEVFASKILECFLKIKKVVLQRAFLNNAYRNIVPLTIINGINEEVETLKAERDLLPISEFNTIISEEIQHQPAPYIYERLGEKYRHYFIDEFQDTSEMQWHNLLPLVGNALESLDELGNQGSLMLVGDVKQAIYRWRGGKAEQFMELLEPDHSPFPILPKPSNLPSNFRSSREIVSFNNSFFNATQHLLGHPKYRKLFEESRQEIVNQDVTGFIRLEFLEQEEGLETNYCQNTLRVIESALGKGFKYDDICILTRKRKQGMLISDFLMGQGVPVVSSETLLLKNSEKVNFLLHLFQYVNQPANLEYAFQLLYYLSKDKDDIHAFIEEHLEVLPTYFLKAYGFDFQRLQKSSVYDGMEYAIRQFGLADISDAYLSFLLDEVLEVEQKEGSGIPKFLEYWEQHKEKLSIAAPEGIVAVKVMTIHQSKGLEFPLVIFPFANSRIYEEIDPKLWVPSPELSSEGFNWLLISKKKEVANYNDDIALLFENEKHKLELDAFNLLYVALTRAETALYVLTEKELSAKGFHNPNKYSGLFIHYLQECGLWNPEKTSYEFGSLDQRSNTSSDKTVEQEIVHGYSFKDRPEFRILANSGILWDSDREKALERGNLIHNVLASVITANDLKPALDKLQFSGDINSEEQHYLENKISHILKHPRLEQFFSPDVTAKNEVEILTKNGLILRPDRVVLKEGKASVLDYKTGKPNASHPEQVLTYTRALKDMGLEVEQAVLIYIDEQITAQFIPL